MAQDQYQRSVTLSRTLKVFTMLCKSLHNSWLVISSKLAGEKKYIDYIDALPKVGLKQKQNALNPQPVSNWASRPMHWNAEMHGSHWWQRQSRRSLQQNPWREKLHQFRYHLVMTNIAMENHHF